MRKCNFTIIIFVVVVKIQSLGSQSKFQTKHRPSVILCGWVGEGFFCCFCFFGNLLHSKLKEINSYEKGNSEAFSLPGHVKHLARLQGSMNLHSQEKTGPMVLIMKNRSPHRTTSSATSWKSHQV